jgi:electron transport complex protein RnfE
MATVMREFTKGLWAEIPPFRLVLGLCPTLAVTKGVENGIGMGIALAFVLVCSNMVISMVRKIIPNKVRIACFIVVIATFVTIVELIMEAYLPTLNASLGIYVPLIVVNCVILGRAEAFASRHAVGVSILDGLGMGAGFSLALLLLGAVREILGSNTLWGYQLCPGFQPALIMILPPGAFLTIAFLLGLFQIIRERKSRPVSPGEALADTEK